MSESPEAEYHYWFVGYSNTRPDPKHKQFFVCWRDDGVWELAGPYTFAQAVAVRRLKGRGVPLADTKAEIWTRREILNRKGLFAELLRELHGKSTNSGD